MDRYVSSMELLAYSSLAIAITLVCLTLVVCMRVAREKPASRRCPSCAQRDKFGGPISNL